MGCRACDGSCDPGAFDDLLTDELRWLWEQLADAADRRGDPALVSGTLTARAPAGVDERAAAIGLLGGRLAPSQSRRVDLAQLAARLHPLTPGAVAAHAVGRPLAQRAVERAARQGAEDKIRAHLAEEVPAAATDEAWGSLRRSGWVTRLLQLDAQTLIDQVAAVVGALPAPGDPPVDRRVLALAAGSPHRLDAGEPTAGLCLAVLGATGRIPSGCAPREAWAAVGVAYDDITGGLTVLGIAPVGWSIPPGSPLTLPPRVLSSCSWTQGGGEPVFVTENPSVLAAAVEVVGSRAICTSGTPSRTEIAALARLGAAGWSLRVRADFDDAGLAHTASVLDAAEGAAPWRMGAPDYLEGLERRESTDPLRIDRLPATPWDPDLLEVMCNRGVAVYEECFLDVLVKDVASAA
ncbi:MAG TPA: DUF2399 domain-containing protein [Acidimicrobiales bacterium]|nr:DUF2399 domain-containing protein [Acidimicrobiales bacterium]